MPTLEATPGLVLPPQLLPDFDDSAQSIHENWVATSFDELVENYDKVPLQETVDTRFAVIEPASGEADPDATILMPLPIGKIWSPEAYMTAAIVRDLVDPNGRIVVLPNNNNGERSYNLSKKEKQQAKAGNYQAFSERDLRICEALGVDSLALVTGHSWGAVRGASFGRYAGDHVQVRANLLNEPPNAVAGGRTFMNLRKAMTDEAKLVVPAYEEMGLPAMSEAVHLDKPLRFKYELARFAAGSNLRTPNWSICAGFKTDSFFNDVTAMLSNNEAASVLLTSAAFSKVSSTEGLTALANMLNLDNGALIARHDTYDGYHVTGSNPVVQGLLGRRAVQLQKRVEAARAD